MSNDKRDDPKAKDPVAATLGAKGGKARAANLTPERLSEIARKGGLAKARAAAAPKATHEGALMVGDLVIPCYNLADGRRVLSRTAMIQALGMSRGTAKREHGDRLASFLASNVLKRFVSEALTTVIAATIPVRRLSGGIPVVGCVATALVDICDVVLRAREAGALQKQQAHIAKQASVLILAFAKTGIIALVDEATGYQADRARDELQKILAAYVEPEMRPYVPLFPTEFFKQIYKLHGWQFIEGNAKHPGVVGHFINEWIYRRLPSPVLPKLRELNPTTENGRRRHKHHQYLTVDTGLPHLDGQINSVVALMRAASGDKALFERLLANAYPAPGEQMHLIPGDPKNPERRR